MQIRSISSDTVDGLIAQLTGFSRPSFASIHCNADCDVTKLFKHLDGAAVLGASSCLGAMTSSGTTQGLAAFTIEDPEGSYGAGIADIDDDARAAARLATTEALKSANRPGEVPDLVWIAGTPGHEEAIIEGIEDVLGNDVPIIGGSAADNSVAGDWFVFDDKRQTQAGVSVTVMFPSRPLSFAYQSGYAPTEKTGRVTKAEDRTIYEIDGRPAMDVYSDWTNGEVSASPVNGTAVPILSDSTLWPLGRKMGGVGEISQFLLAHPASTSGKRELDMFASLEEGEEITLMSGSIDSLTERAGRTAALARSTAESDGGEIAGALMIYCGGCMLAVRESLGDVIRGVNDALGDAPFVGAFTFGEQGPILNTGNRHGNLMISCIVFS